MLEPKSEAGSLRARALESWPPTRVALAETGAYDGHVGMRACAVGETLCGPWACGACGAWTSWALWALWAYARLFLALVGGEVFVHGVHRPDACHRLGVDDPSARPLCHLVLREDYGPEDRRGGLSLGSGCRISLDRGERSLELGGRALQLVRG